MPYIHPADNRIADFSDAVCKNNIGLEAMCRSILAWFDGCVEYSRLQAPFFPLQRSDIDLLDMKAGTCGDYSNLLVSVLLANGFDARYAYVHRDSYGDAQDHICAAVNVNGGHILIDAALPYRKWHGFDCPHREFELLSPVEFELRMMKEEAYWRAVAEKHGRPLLAGLLYAPWVHAEPVFESDELYDDVFYLLTLDERLEPKLFVYYRRYTPRESALPIMAEISAGGTLYRFSVRPRKELWDNEQWSECFPEAVLPDRFITDELRSLKGSISKVLPHINGILDRAGCGRLK